MSGPKGRITRVEERFSGCPTCRHRHALFEIVCPSRRYIPGPDTDTGPCPDCGQPRRVITTVWSFDCFAGEHEGPPPGSVQRERERRSARKPRPKRA